jgi:uncharacterized protein
MGFKDLFKRKKKTDDGDEDDDDFDADDFDDSDESDGDAAAVPDEGDSNGESEDPGFGGSSLDSGSDDTPEDPQSNDDMADDVAGDDAVSDGAAGDAPEGDDDFGELDMEGDESDFDEDDEDDDDEGGGLFSNPLVLYSTIGVGVLLILIGVGVGGWLLLSDDEEVADQGEEKVSSGIALPPLTPSGGLNDLAGVSDKPPESDTVKPTNTAASLSAVQSAGGLNALASGGLNSIGSGGGAAGLIVQASTRAAFEQYLDHPTPDPLSRAPDPSFLDILEDGAVALPKVASDGRLPWEFYSRPTDVGPDQNRVAILVTGLGLSQAATLSAISKLPPAVTLSFSPYADDLDQWLLRSRRAGHEVMLGLPLESSRFPIEDPGPMALQTSFSQEDNLIRLEAIMASFAGYIGFEVIMGSRFTTDEPQMLAMLDALNSRGLMVLDGVWNNRSLLPKLAGDIGLPRTFSEIRLDKISALSAIDTKLEELDSLVATRKQAIATTAISPAIMGRLKTWFQTLPTKNMKLVPVSALVTTKLAAPVAEPE